MPIILTVLAYFAVLFGISRLTARRSTNETFYRADRRSPWYMVAFGMVGASISGVTFVSVPGMMQQSQMTYLQTCLGFVLGYVMVAFVLLPLYYRLNLTSIYTYLGLRYGPSSQKTGSLFFILSRLMGSAIRMYLVVFVLYEYIFKDWGLPFWVPAVVFILIILAYTFKGGVKTVVWTDTLQTTFLLLAAAVTVVCILRRLDISFFALMREAADQGYTRVFETDWTASKFYVKQLLSGAFITIAMTGLDQDMMQKNLSCRSLKDARKNILTSSGLFVVVNILFLCLGAALVAYAQRTGFALPVNGDGVVVNDKIFPSVAFSLSKFTTVVFVIGLVAAGYSSADGTLTALTTTVCFDFLHFDSSNRTEEEKKRLRYLIHIGFALMYLIIIVVFKPFHRESLIDTIFAVAGYTYGPLLGLFAFGLFTRRKVRRDSWVPLMALVPPVLCFFLDRYSQVLFHGYRFGFELLLLNGLLMFLLLWVFSRKGDASAQV